MSLHAKSLLPILLARSGRLTSDDAAMIDALRRWNFDAQGRALMYGPPPSNSWYCLDFGLQLWI